MTYEQIKWYFERIRQLNTFRGYTVRDQQTDQLIAVGVKFIRPWYKGEQYHLDSFYVSQQFSKRKIGTRLLNFIKEELGRV